VGHELDVRQLELMSGWLARHLPLDVPQPGFGKPASPPNDSERTR
jgi:hypothetical protein